MEHTVIVHALRIRCGHAVAFGGGLERCGGIACGNNRERDTVDLIDTGNSVSFLLHLDRFPLLIWEISE